MKFTIFFMFAFFYSVYSAEYKYTSVFSFGDSLADTGNFLHSGANLYQSISNLPYGMTYFRNATGRCSDGRLVVDFIAEAMGLPMLPPYLIKGQNFSKGVNFAVAGATALDPSFFNQIGAGFLLWTKLSLRAQIGWFEEVKPSLCNTAQECNDYFRKSLFLVGEIGGNDYNYGFFSGNSVEQVKAYAPQVVDTIITSAQKLIDLGAVNLVIPGNLPIGCSVIYLTLFSSANEDDYDTKIGCLKQHNEFAKYHNSLLVQALHQLQTKNPRAKILYADYYNAAMEFVRSPKHYGFIHGAQMTCCGCGGGKYNFDLNIRCGQPGSTACTNPSSYANWDGIHLTEAAYRIIASYLLNNTLLKH